MMQLHNRYRFRLSRESCHFLPDVLWMASVCLTCTTHVSLLESFTFVHLFTWLECYRIRSKRIASYRIGGCIFFASFARILRCFDNRHSEDKSRSSGKCLRIEKNEHLAISWHGFMWLKTCHGRNRALKNRYAAQKNRGRLNSCLLGSAWIIRTQNSIEVLKIFLKKKLRKIPEKQRILIKKCLISPSIAIVLEGPFWL